MFRLTALILIVPAFALAAPVPKEKGKELYLPVVEGTIRVMESKIGERTVEITETVTKVEVKDGAYTVTMDQGAGGWSTAFEVSEKGITRPPLGGGTERMPDLKLGGKPGDTWEYMTAGFGGRTMTRKYTLGKVEEVEVPAGKFRAVRVDVEADLGEVTNNQTAWYAAGVGW